MVYCFTKYLVYLVIMILFTIEFLRSIATYMKCTLVIGSAKASAYPRNLKFKKKISKKHLALKHNVTTNR